MTSKSKYEIYTAYRNALHESENYSEPAIGFTRYLGKVDSDKTYPKQLNFIIALIVDLHDKLGDLNKKIKILEDKITQPSAADIDNLTQEFKNLSASVPELPKLYPLKPATWGPYY